MRVVWQKISLRAVFPQLTKSVDLPVVSGAIIKVSCLSIDLPNERYSIDLTFGIYFETRSNFLNTFYNSRRIEIRLLCIERQLRLRYRRRYVYNIEVDNLKDRTVENSNIHT